MKLEGLQIKYVASATLAVLALVLVVGAASRKIRQTNQKEPSQTVPVVVNKTNAIKVMDISVTRSGTVEVTLLNQSAKLISFYTFAIGEGHVMPISGIASGSSTVQRFSLSDFVTSEGTKRDLTILALSFGGGGGEGDPEEVFNLEEITQGMKEQFEAYLPALSRAASSQTSESEELAKTFESDIAQVAVSEGKDIPSEARKGGRHLATLMISNDVRELRDRKRLDPTKTYKNRLAERLSHYQKIVSEL